MTHPVTPAGASFTFDLRIYSLASIKKAVYRFTSDYVANISKSSEWEAVVTLEPKHPGKAVRIDAKSLPNEVVDQDLRELVAAETLQVRNILLAQAFSGLAITDSTGESVDFRDDPMHIAGEPHPPKDS